MTLTAIYANLSCTDLARSKAWYEKLFGRAPDAEQMQGLAEWHHGDAAGLQLYEKPEDAGRGTLTLIVARLREERDRLAAASLEPGAVEPADYTSLVRLADPDGNLVVLAQPGRA